MHDKAMGLWKEFIQAVQKCQLAQERIRPHMERLREPIVDFLKELSKKADAEELEKTPEVFQVNNYLHYLLALTIDGEKRDYCFTLLIEDDYWFFCHLESISIRLDRLPPPPTSAFPDIAQEQKHWIREKIAANERVRLFNYLSQAEGRDFALNWFKDGAGYFLSAKTWVPFLRPREAFILYACWELQNLRGNTVVLEKLASDEAVLQVESIFLSLYTETADLKQQISFEDYYQIFQTAWQDRAQQAGWRIQISCKDENCTFRFLR